MMKRRRVVWLGCRLRVILVRNCANQNINIYFINRIPGISAHALSVSDVDHLDLDRSLIDY
jgi:hypothetical protein